MYSVEINAGGEFSLVEIVFGVVFGFCKSICMITLLKFELLFSCLCVFFPISKNTSDKVYLLG